MARQVGGGDNVMGSKEAIVNVSFKDDLGNILENASQLKDILDSVNQNFLAINSAVGITTQTMGKLASQTQRLVATTQQLRNEYQTIADASQRIGLSQSIAPASSIFQNTDVVRDALSGTGGARGLVLGGGGGEAGPIFGSTAGFDKLMTETYPQRFRRTQAWNQLPSSEVRSIVSNTDDLEERARLVHERLVEDNKARLAGVGDLSDQDRAWLTREKLQLDLSLKKTYQRRSREPQYFFKNDPNNKLNVGVGTQVWEDWQSGASTGSIVRGLLTSFGGARGAAMAAAIPYITAGVGVGVALYKSMDYLVKGATRYSGLTGGTGVLENTGAAEGSATFLGLQGRAWWEGLRNMAVGPGGFQAIQEGLLGAGYTARDSDQYAKLGIKGLRYESARSVLASLYGKGLQDIDQNLQLMQLVVERGGGSLTTLTGTIDNLRETALTSNASLKVMTATLATSMAGLIGGMNVAGNVAAFVGGNNAAAFADSANSLLRGSGAPNYNDFITQMMMLQSPSFRAAGVTADNMYYMMAHPELFPKGQEGLAIAQATDYMADRLFRFPVPKGSTLQEAKDIISQDSNYVRRIMQSPMFKAAVNDPNIYNSVDASIEWLARHAIGDPQTEIAKANRKENLAHNILDPREGQFRTIRDPRTGKTTRQFVQTSARRIGKDADIDAYLEKTFGAKTSLLGRAVQGLGYFTEFALPAAGYIIGGPMGALTTAALMTPGAAMVTAGRNMDEVDLTGPAGQAYADAVRATGKTAGWSESVLNNPDATAPGRTYIKMGDQIIGFRRFMEEIAAGNKEYQRAWEGTGQTIYIGEKEKGQAASDISKWTESGEFGGGGSMSRKSIMDMDSYDFSRAVAQGLRNFNKNDRLRVTEKGQ